MILTFPVHKSGNEHGAFNGEMGVFTAPVNGRYQFGLHLMVYGSAGTGYHYVIQVLQNGSQVHRAFTSGIRETSPGTYADHDGRYFQIELELNKGQVVTFYVEETTPISYSGYSMLEGKLVKMR